MLFCFNQTGKRKCIGNLELPSDKYFSIKAKLLDEMRDELKKNKRFPSTFELFPKSKPKEKLLEKEVKEEEEDIEPINKGFASTFKILFKKDAEPNIFTYQKWLTRNIDRYNFYEIDSAVGGKTYRFKGDYFRPWKHFPQHRAVNFEQAKKLSYLHLEESELSSLNKIIESLDKIAYLSEEGKGGKNM